METNRLTNLAKQVIKRADYLASWRADDEVLRPIDILWGIINTPSPARSTVVKALPTRSTYASLKLEVLKWSSLMTHSQPRNNNRPPSPETKDVMWQATYIAKGKRITPLHLLYGLLKIQETKAFELLQQFGITETNVLKK